MDLLTVSVQVDYRYDLFISMSTEKIITTETNDLPPLETPEMSEEVSSSGRVDINILLNRARKEKEKENLTNLVFVGLTSCLIIVAGIILSF